MFSISRRALLVCAASACSLSAHAQNAEWPSRPITIVVPYGAGSSTDIMTRLVAKRMAQDLGQAIVVENRSGAGGALGSGHVAKAAPDGYTLVMGTISSHSINVSMMKQLPYDVLRDFTPISLAAYFPNLLAVGKNVPVNSLAELVALAKKKGGLNFATGGVGSSAQLAGELLKLRTGAPLIHIPYKDIGQGITDTVAGHVPVVIYQVPALASHVKSGSLKAISVLAPKRTTLLPDVPVPSEQGIKDFDATAWMGLFGPAGMSPEIVAKLNQALAASIKDPEVRTQLEQQGFTPATGSAADFKQFVAADIAKWAEVVKATGAKIE